MKVSKIALAAVLALGGGALILPQPAEAQRAPRGQQQQQQEAQQSGPQLQLSRQEREALVPLQNAIQSGDQAAALAALPAAQAAAQGADARYAVAQFQLRLGIDRQDIAMQSAAIDAMIASGAAPAETLPQLYSNQGALAANQGDLAKAEQAFARLVELNPNDPQALAQLAEVKNDRDQKGEAVQLLQRAMQAMRDSGQQVPENWHKRALAIAYDGNMGPQSIALAQELVRAYPTQENWRDAMMITRELSQLDRDATLDLLRLQRVSNSLNGERDYFELAETLNGAGLPGEANSVLQDGVSRNMIDGNKPVFRELRSVVGGRIDSDRSSLAGQEAGARSAANGRAALGLADAYYGYGDYAKAVEFYRLAREKGGVDANVVNTRLGMALAQGGQRAEAETAFRAVSGTPRDTIAAFWLLWLQQSA